MTDETHAIEPTADEARDRALERRRKALAICAAEPEASFENVWHALILLEMSPLERLDWSLTRGRGTGPVARTTAPVVK
jgi:hypothetical protein